MWVIDGDKKTILDFIDKGDLKTFNVKSEKQIKPIYKEDQIYLIWNKKPTKINIPFPEIVCIKDGSSRNFLAWVSTYINDFIPFTSFVRVIEYKKLVSTLERRRITFNNVEENAAIGALVGEIVTHRINNNIKDITMSSAMSTLSFALGNGLFEGYHLDNYIELLMNWEKARKLSKQQKRVLDVESIIAIWEVVYNICEKNAPNRLFKNNDDYEINACKSIISKGFYDFKNVYKNEIHSNALEWISTNKKYTREESIKIFEELSHPKNLSKISNGKESFVLGYLAYKIAPGETNYYELIVPFLKNYPNCIMWYFILSSFSNYSNILCYNNGVGWRILQKIYSNIDTFDKPKCDLSVDELEVFLNVDKPKTNFLVEHRDQLIVEIAPMINITIHWPSSMYKSKTEVYSEYKRKEKFEYLMNSLGQSIISANSIYKELVMESKFRK
jgi:hypothetical protein